MENFKRFKEFLIATNLNFEEEGYTIIVHHPHNGSFKHALTKSRDMFDIAMKFEPMVIKPINDFTATMVKF